MKIKAIVGAVRFTLTKYSPEILLGVGITGMVGGAVLACHATLGAEKVLQKRERELELIETCVQQREDSDLDYPVQMEKTDRFISNRHLVFGFVKLYAPSVTLIAASVGCILASYRIMSKRNAALMAAYKLLEEAFSNYRKRVVDELGDEKDGHFMYGTDEETVIHNEDGTTTKVGKRSDSFTGLSGFARTFEAETPDQLGGWTGATQWSAAHEYNLAYLEAKMKHFNDLLVVKGFVTVNDVYAELGFAPTEAGMICGWRYKSERGDGYISFKPHGIDGNWAFGTDGDPIMLDFNVDGVIFDQSVAAKELR